MVDDLGARTRDRVLYILKTKGPQTASQLAERLEVTAMAVRQHLAGLEAEGLVCFEEERRRVGRPARVWRLHERAASRFPDAHAELTADLLDSLREAFGEEGVDRLLQTRMRRQLETYRARLPAPQDGETGLAGRVAALAAIRNEEGYMAEWHPDRSGSGDGFVLVENHCPICVAARTCQGLCRDELELFRTLFGDDVRVERSEHLLAGARRCAYEIRPR